MAHRSELLTTAPAKPAGVARRCTAGFRPLILLVLMFYHGIGPAMQQQLGMLTSQPWKLFSPWAWRDDILGAGMPIVLDASDAGWAPIKKTLLGEASGDVLEVGVGGGTTLKYYDIQRVNSFTLLETRDALRSSLQTVENELDLSSKTKVLPLSIDKRSELAANGVKPNTFDTVVMVQILCSIPNPQSQLKYLQSLLKPGGKLLLFEHVRSTSLLTHAQQTMWTYPVYKFATARCCLDRDSARWLRDIGGWSGVSIARPADEDVAETVPHAIAIFTKAQ